MININKHRHYLMQILRGIYADKLLASSLGFKGGTALMFFYDLPRFSVDLDFNLLVLDKHDVVYEKLRKIVAACGTIHDEAKKYYGDILVLDYGEGERKLKVEVSNRQFCDSYEIKNLLGISVRVMKISQMFSHKLCALLDRDVLVNRDIFDCHFFMQKKTALCSSIIEQRMGMPLNEYLEKCIETIEQLGRRSLLDGLGELVAEEQKSFIRNDLKNETISLLKLYQSYPIVE